MTTLKTLYKVTDPRNDALILIGPIATLREVFDLRDGALDRIEKETRNGGVCDLHFNYGRTRIGFGAVNVEEAP